MIPKKAVLVGQRLPLGILIWSKVLAYRMLRPLPLLEHLHEVSAADDGIDDEWEAASAQHMAE